MKNLAGLLAIPLLVACAAGTGSPPASDDEITSPELIRSFAAAPSTAAVPSQGMGGVPQDLLDDVIALAEEETGVDRSEIEVVLAESVTWSDGSIGCPEDGMMYTQALVPGYRVVLDIAGEELAFHAPESGEFFPCANPIAPAEGSGNS